MATTLSLSLLSILPLFRFLHIRHCPVKLGRDNVLRGVFERPRARRVLNSQLTLTNSRLLRSSELGIPG